MTANAPGNFAITVGFTPLNADLIRSELQSVMADPIDLVSVQTTSSTTGPSNAFGRPARFFEPTSQGWKNVVVIDDSASASEQG